MSRTYSIACPSCGEWLCVGQGSSPEKAYLYDGEAVHVLTKFLFKHKGHDLVFGDTEVLINDLPCDALRDFETGEVI
jgi:hypothetical protein